MTDQHHGQKTTGETDHQSDHDSAEHHDHAAMFRTRFWVSLLLSLPVLLYSPTLQDWLNFSVPTFPGSEWVPPLFSILVFGYGGFPFLQMAVPELKDHRPGMMSLISLAIGVAFIFSLATIFFPLGESFFWELVTLIDVMLLGHWIEMRSVRQASGALDELAGLLPNTAERVTEDGGTEEVSVSDLAENDRVLVRPGASIPADGEIVEGQSELNEAMITGESKPAAKQKGDTVIAGTINGDGSLRVQVTATGDGTALAGIMRLVEQARQSKSRTQLLADKAAAWLFYLALGVALLTAVGWMLAIGADIEVLKRVVTVLVIACPHALGLAIPLVVAISTSLAARNGVLIRDRLALESARNLDTIIFDKTGTLTKGEHGVVGIATVAGYEDEEALALAAAVEGDSEHMIARGIREAAHDKGVFLPPVQDFEAIKGKGVRARYEDQTVWVGGPNLLKAHNISLADELTEFSEHAGQKGQAVVYLLKDDQSVAAFALADAIRPESKKLVMALNELGIETAMLTGDSEAVARAVAEELQIETCFAEVLPEDKSQKVAELQSRGQMVAMVGDGVNDAPALAKADIGIAIGGGTDVAIESAGIILVQSNPLDVAKIIELSKSSYRKMQENLVWATAYNIVALPLAAGVLAPIGFVLSPAVGALLMSVSTVIVALNAQLLRRMQFTS